MKITRNLVWNKSIDHDKPNCVKFLQHFAPKVYYTGQNMDLIRILKTKSLICISLNNLG